MTLEELLERWGKLATEQKRLACEFGNYYTGPHMQFSVGSTKDLCSLMRANNQHLESVCVTDRSLFARFNVPGDNGTLTISD